MINNYIRNSRSTIAPPSMTLAMLEPYRALSEFAGMMMAAPMLSTAPRGDGHPVLVLPGLSANDVSTTCLRSYLNYLGYRSAEWALGRNLGYQTLGKSEERLRQLVVKLAADAGQKISIIGWSMGGVMARHMARDYPELVRQVITLAAPFTGDPSATNVRHYYEFVTGDRLDTEESKSKWHANRTAPAVPATAIFSKTDGVTAWQNCLEVETSSAENIEVCGSHMGLPHNPMALYAIADRLAQPEADWRPYAVARA